MLPAEGKPSKSRLLDSSQASEEAVGARGEPSGDRPATSASAAGAERVTNAARSGADGRARSPRGGAGTARRKRGAGSTFGQRQEAWETLHPGNSAARASARACDQAPSRRARPVTLPPTAFRRAWRGPPCLYPRRAPSSEPLPRPLRAPRSGLADGARRWRCCRLPASPFLP